MKHGNGSVRFLIFQLGNSFRIFDEECMILPIVLYQWVRLLYCLFYKI